jgi:GMP synthase-like glutamine amidotransferase
MAGAMSAAIVLQHVPYAGPGILVPVLRDYGIPVQIRHLYRGDEVPTDLDELRVLVVLGGPMGVADVGSEKFPYLAKEVETLKRLVAQDRPVLGIALGAQLLASAAGAKVYPNVKPGAKPEDPPIPVPEYGWHPLNFPFPGGTEPIVYGMTDGAHFFQWHRESFDLPKLPPPPNPAPPPAPPPPTGSALLASSRLCKNQAFRFKSRLFGFQFHFESTSDEIAAIAREDPSAKETLGPDVEQKIAEDTNRYYARYERLGKRLIRNFVQYLKAY